MDWLRAHTELRDLMSLLAAVGTLSLAVTMAFAGRRSILAKQLAALCFVLFGWNFCTLVHHLLRSTTGTPNDAFTTLDAIFTALSPPLLFEVVLSFVGRARRHRRARIAAWIVFGGLALAASEGFVAEPFRAWNDRVEWPVIFLLGYIPTFVFEVVLLSQYLRATADPNEKARTRLALSALAIGGSFGLSDIAHGAGLPAPYLGAIGTLIASTLLALLVVRRALFDRNVSARTTVYVLAMITSFVVAYFIVFSAFAGRIALQVFAASILALLVAAVARELAVSTAETRQRTQQLAVLGRFSAQMAHDIKGPLTALLGAVQLLDTKESDPNKEFLDLAAEQAKRIQAIVERYDQMARVEPQKTLVRLNDIVKACASAHGVPSSNQKFNAETTIECNADPSLIESAIENVVRNAVEATSKNAKLVHLETRLDARAFYVCVRDEGPGMDARTLERSTEDFFTTKANGSGLGLSFARRVFEAHGGAVAITSHLGKGTTVELRLPRD